MAEVCVVLVEPKLQCNVGFVARTMKNFGVSKLYYSGRAFSPDDKAFECAARAKDVLENSEHLGRKSVNDVFDIVIGTTAKPHTKENSPRMAITLRELSLKLKAIRGTAALLFGREDTGLVNAELDGCDLVVTIPTNPEYGVLNIAHAAAIILYELTTSTQNQAQAAGDIRAAVGADKEALIKRLKNLLDALEYPNYKKKVTERIFRRVMGRAGISGREAHTLAGVFKEAVDEIERRA